MIKTLLASFLALTFALADAHILVYHRFDDSRHTSTDISIKNLREQFEYFKNNGYEVVKLSKLVDALNSGEEIPDNWIVITVDDGYKSFYDKALSVFKEYNYPFALMLYVEASANKYGDYLDFDQIKELETYGEIGYHSYAHPRMTKLSDEALREDFQKGVETFEKHMGYKPKFFAVPYGEIDSRVVKLAKEFGFLALLNQNSGAVSDKSDVFDLYRTPVMNGTKIALTFNSKFLNAQWIFPDSYPQNNAIDKLIIKTDTNASEGSFFMTGFNGFKKVPMTNGVFECKFNPPLDKRKVLISLKVDHQRSTKLLIKDINAK
jgi:polysaccharide deacetylase